MYCFESWNVKTGVGVANASPGIIFGDDNEVAPDLIWISYERLATALGADGILHAAPELVVEVLSPWSENERRDREFKREMYARLGVLEYWIVDWQRRQVEVYRREQARLHLVTRLYVNDMLTTPLLPDFACAVGRLFAN